MQFTLHATRRTPHGASCLVQAMSTWLVKTRRAPSRHSRDARVYGHTTTAMHKLSTPPPPLLQHLAALRAWCKQCLPGRLKPDMLRPRIVGMRGSIPYGHTTTAMYEYRVHPASSPPPRPSPFLRAPSPARFSLALKQRTQHSPSSPPRASSWGLAPRVGCQTTLR